MVGEDQMTINGTMLRAMSEELVALTKEAAMDKEAFPALGAIGSMVGRGLSTLGGKVIGGSMRGLGTLAKQEGRLGSAAGQVRDAARTGIKTMVGEGGIGGRALKQGVGAATLGVGALGAGAVGSRLLRPQPRGY